MLPNGNPILLALLTAYCALALPVSTQPDQVQADQVHAFVDALRAQLEADNVTNAWAPVVDEAEAFLLENEALNKEMMAKLGQEIETLTVERGFSVDDIAQDTFEYLKAETAVQKRDQEETANDTATHDTETIKQVVDHGGKHRKRHECPDGSQAKLCCVIM